MNSAPVISSAAPTSLHLHPTPILDFHSTAVQAVRSQIQPADDTDLSYLQACHHFLATHVSPIYAVDELQSASATITKLKGSCSQRFACLEALARARKIATRVRGLWIRGRFWAPRFPLSRLFIPRRILLAWPQFYLDGAWMSVEMLFGSLEEKAQRNPKPFTNNGESIFDALPHTAIDFGGQTAQCAGGTCDLSAFVAGSAGVFASRDDLFAAYPLFQYTLRGRVFKMIYSGKPVLRH